MTIVTKIYLFLLLAMLSGVLIGWLLRRNQGQARIAKVESWWRARITEEQHDHDRLKNKLEALQRAHASQIADLQAANLELEGSVMNARAEAMLMQGAGRDSSAAPALDEAQQQAKEQELASREQHLDDVGLELQALRNQLVDRDVYLGRAREKIESQRAEIVRLTETLSERGPSSDDALTELRVRYSTLEQRLGQAEQGTQDVAAAKAEIERELSRVRTSLEQAQIDRLEAIAGEDELKQALGVSERTLVDLQNELQQLRAHSEHLQNANQSLTVQSEQDRQELARLRQLVQDLEQQLAQTRAEQQRVMQGEIEQRLTQLQSDLQAKQSDVTRLEHKLRDAQTQAALAEYNLERDAARHGDQMLTLQQQITSLEATLHKQNLEFDALQTGNQQLQAQQTAASQRGGDAERPPREIERLRNALERALDKMRLLLDDPAKTDVAAAAQFWADPDGYWQKLDHAIAAQQQHSTQVLETRNRELQQFRTKLAAVETALAHSVELEQKFNAERSAQDQLRKQLSITQESLLNRDRELRSREQEYQTLQAQFETLKASTAASAVAARDQAAPAPSVRQGDEVAEQSWHQRLYELEQRLRELEHHYSVSLSTLWERDMELLRLRNLLGPSPTSSGSAATLLN